VTNPQLLTAVEQPVDGCPKVLTAPDQGWRVEHLLGADQVATIAALPADPHPCAIERE
jgi:hypothetical protein